MQSVGSTKFAKILKGLNYSALIFNPFRICLDIFKTTDCIGGFEYLILSGL